MLPRANPSSLTREKLRFLVEEPYWVAEKTNGVGYLLVLFRRANGQNCAVMVNRAWAMYEVQVWASDDVFGGTAFDGELVWDEAAGCNKFLLFDALAFGGRTLRHEHLPQRYAFITQMFLPWAEWNPVNTADLELANHLASQMAADEHKIIPCADPLDEHRLFMCPKQQFRLAELPVLVAACKTTTHSIDGFVLSPLKERIVVGSHPKLLKYKFKPSFDLLVLQSSSSSAEEDEAAVESKQNDNLETRQEEEKLLFFGGFPDEEDEGWTDAGRLVGCYFAKERRVVPLAHAFPDIRFWISASARLEKGTLVELTLTPRTQGSESQFNCHVLDVRHDKLDPNPEYIVGEVAREVIENITIPELCELASNRKLPAHRKRPTSSKAEDDKKKQEEEVSASCTEGPPKKTRDDEEEKKRQKKRARYADKNTSPPKEEEKKE